MRLAIALVLALAISGASARVYGAEPHSPLYQTPQVVSVRTAQASEDRLVTSLTYSGDVRAVSQIDILPKATGRLERLWVDVGSRVKVGDVIGELDSASLEAQVAQAQANVAAATARYNNMEAGPRPEQVAQALAQWDTAVIQLSALEGQGRAEQVEQAAANLASARSKLQSLLNGGRQEQRAQAEANLASAREVLSDMEDGNRGEQVAQAEANLRTAWARKDQVIKGPTAEAQLAAQAAVDQARAAALTARAGLETVRKGPTEAEMATARAAVDTAQANLRAAETQLADVREGAEPADIQAAEAAVEQARAALAAAEDLRDLAQDVNDPSVLGPTGVTSAGQAERAVAAAQANLDAAVERLNQVRSAPQPAALQAAQSAADSARANLTAAEASLEEMMRGATPEAIQQAEAAVWQAESALASADAQSRQVLLGPTAEDIAVAEAAVTQAEQALNLAKEPFTAQDLAQDRNAVTVAEEQAKLAANPYTPQDIEQGRAAVVVAEQQYQLAARPHTGYEIAQARSAATIAEEQYKLAQNPYTEFDMEAARAAVMQAEAALQIAEAALAEAVMTSPVDGIVAERFVSTGAMVSPTTPIVSIISSDVEVIVGVEEGQIGNVREGQRAEITVAAYPGTVFDAVVALVAPAADPASRTFQVRVRPVAQDGRLRPGMFAEVRIITQEKAGAILVPKEAVVTRSGQPVVFVVVGDVVQQRQVVLGAEGDTMIEIVSGVQAGEEVVIAGQGSLQDGQRVRRGG